MNIENDASAFYEKFVRAEIKEFSDLNNLAFNDVYKNYSDCALNIDDLKRILDIKTRGIVYELLVLFKNERTDLNLLFNCFLNVIKASTTKEKNYLVEKKTLIKLKDLFAEQNKNEWDFFNAKIAFIITRRLCFINSDVSIEGANQEIEVSQLLQLVLSDIWNYKTTLQIKFQKTNHIDQKHLKAFILRILILLSEGDSKINLAVKQMDLKTTYFIKSGYSAQFFMHLHARVLLAPAVIIQGKNLALNGGYHYLNKKKLIEPNLYNLKTIVKSEIISFVQRQNIIGFVLDKKMILIQDSRVQNYVVRDKQQYEKGRDFLKNDDSFSLTHNAETKIDLNVYKQRLKKIRHWRTIDNNEQLLKLNLKIKAALQSKTFNKLLLDKLSTKKKFIESLLEKGHHFGDPKSYYKLEQKNLSRMFSLKIYLEFIDFFQNYEGALYFILFFDFRGRHYYHSLVAPTQGGPFRFLYYFDHSIQYFSLINTNARIQDISKSNISHEKYHFVFDHFKICARAASINKSTLLGVFFSIGALMVQKKEKIEESEFIFKGFACYLSREEVSNELENSELQYYYLILDEWNNETPKHRYIFKDVSGSIFQNASLILGIKDSDALSRLNLDGDVGCDPYFPMIKEIQNLVDKRLLRFFNRKTLKKSIMTRYYNAKLLTSFSYFIEEVKKDAEYSVELYDALGIEFKKVYQKLDELEKKTLFANSKNDFVAFLNHNGIHEIEYTDFQFDLRCYKLKLNRIDIVVNGKRITNSTYELSNQLYGSKINNSVVPNVFHAEDAFRARTLISNLGYKCFCIHDAFAISYLQIHQLICVANLTFDINEKKKFYLHNNRVDRALFSKFILL